MYILIFNEFDWLKCSNEKEKEKKEKKGEKHNRFYVNSSNWKK